MHDTERKGYELYLPSEPTPLMSPVATKPKP